ncbi:MAG: amylo-alpha-1,6-glucosidase [Bacteroidales bacterium]|jgi:predicted glycogen debranching enzyme|nr:amylo-alpha-1,6-glucosidase [Bacteroidales bacterium]MDD3702167.1 amylo-alpha-1,6-glucosidase [Bacteroidales bacterium]MDY0370412.1 amylo-alpha-1,6-glucosidase [Bacteroidales bacterium]
MSYIAFDKTQLINLEFSLARELLRSNRSGSYASTTITGCNTRKYHGLLVSPQPWLDHNKHVLLSAIDESIIQHDEVFNFGVRMYPNGVYNPKGHKYLREFKGEPIPKIVYRVGGVLLSKEMIFTDNEARILIKYTLEDAHSKTILRLKPFLAFRNVHQLTTANIHANNKYEACPDGVSWQMYPGYSRLYMQLSKQSEYTHVPDWYYNIEYIRDRDMGLPATEDLFVPGFFDVEIKKGESIIVSASTEEARPEQLKSMFQKAFKKRTPRDNFENCLINAAEQFLIKQQQKTEIMAGFPWFNTWSRDTFIALPGITLSRNDEASFKAVLDTKLSTMQGPLFPNISCDNRPNFASADAPLWFFWTLQQYTGRNAQLTQVWKKYKKPIITILEGYRQGSSYNIRMLDNYLITAGEPGMALTWMDVFHNGKPVTARTGMAVEINALWYNAIQYALELAQAAKDHEFIQVWKDYPENIQTSFINEFWDEQKAYLADYIHGDDKDWTVRPNMLLAASMPYSMLTDEMQQKVLNRVKSELLTERGLRSLTPTHPDYKGNYKGNQEERNMAYHQGTVFPWLLSHFAEAWLRLYGQSGIGLVEELYSNFEPALFEGGLATISEVFDGDPPHESRGAISQAWSVAALIRIKELIGQFKNNKNKGT